MLDHASELLEMMRDRTVEDLETDRKLELSVLYLLALTGKAARRVSPAGRAAHPELPWREITDLRNFVIHDYDDVDLRRIWETVTVSVRPLVRRLEAILR